MLAVLDRPCILFTRAVRAVVAYLTGWQLVGFVTVCLIANAAGFLWSGAEGGYLVDHLGSLADAAIILAIVPWCRGVARKSQSPAVATTALAFPPRLVPLVRWFTLTNIVLAALPVYRFDRGWFWLDRLGVLAAWALIDGPRPCRTLPSDLRRLSARLRRSAAIPAPAPVAG